MDCWVCQVLCFSCNCDGEKIEMNKKVIEGGLGICLVLGVMLYSYHFKAIEPESRESSLRTDDLYVSENQIGYASSNLGITIVNRENASETENLEFVLKNKSTKKWYWKRSVIFYEENGERETTDLEVKIEETWYDVPLKEDKTDWVTTLVKTHLLPGSTTPISVWTGIYQAIVPGNYRFTITVYDDNFNEFNLSCEFTITKKK